MTDIADDEIHGLINALQLCCNSQLASWLHARRYVGKSPAGKESLRIIFNTRMPYDSGLEKFETLIQGQWEPPKNGGPQTYVIQNMGQIDIGLLTNFLLLTRLQDDQIIALAAQDARFRPFAETLGLSPKEAGVPIGALSDMRDIIFKTIDQKKMSLKTVAELTGLSQVSLSNFKAGNDIRISTLLKLAKALGIKVSLS